MAIKSNITDRRSSREKFKKEITLLSGGYAKPEAFPGGKITVYPWDSKISAWLREQANNATATERERLLFELTAKLCNLGTCPIDDFVLGDVNAVLMTSRAIANASCVKYITVCPKCKEEDSSEIHVPDELKPIGQKAADYKGYDTVTLDESKDIIDVRPLRVRDELGISTRTPAQRQAISSHIAHLIAPVVSINGTQPDRVEELLEWFEALPPHDAEQLEKFIEDNSPHFDQEIPHKCDNCGNLWNFSLVLDENFFRSGRVGTSRRALAANF